MYITSKFLSPTNHRGARYKATIDRGGDFNYQATVSYDYALDAEGNAVEAVKALIEKIDLNQFGVWDSFIIAYGPHGYTAVPSGRGVDHKTYSLRGETTLQSSSKGVA